VLTDHRRFGNRRSNALSTQEWRGRDALATAGGTPALQFQPCSAEPFRVEGREGHPALRRQGGVGSKCPCAGEELVFVVLQADFELLDSFVDRVYCVNAMPAEVVSGMFEIFAGGA
jgi:hypothetical protein